MYIYIYLFIFFFLSKELFYFDEELLVVLSFFTVFTSLYQILSGIISTELDNRCNVIYNQFLSYLKAKRDLLDLVYMYYQKRNIILFNKFINLLSSTIQLIQTKFILKFTSLMYWYQRFTISKLIALILLENSFLKKDFSNLIFSNKTNNIEFFIDNLLLKN